MVHTVDGRNPANQLRLVVYPIIYRVLYISGGAGFLPSTVGFHKIAFHKIFIVPGSKLPLFPYGRGWSSTQFRRGLYTHYKASY